MSDFGKIEIDGGPLEYVADGVTGFYSNGFIYLFCTQIGIGISQIRFDGVNCFYDGLIAVDGAYISSNYRAAAVKSPAATHVFYADASNNLQHVMIKDGTTSWYAGPVPATSLAHGPGTLMHNGDLNVVRMKGDELKLYWLRGASDWNNRQHKAFCDGNPTPVLYNGTMYFFGHAANVLSYVTLNSSNQWSDIVPLGGVQAYGSVGVCKYGDRLYCFYQGGGNTLYMSRYLVSQWSDTFQLTGDKTNNVWYGPWAVPIENSI